jgi:quercetin dioxygenase-like cupin family protein
MTTENSYIPLDGQCRQFVVVRPDDDETLPLFEPAADVYTILHKCKSAEGYYYLIDMHIPPGGGPAPHRHDFEETFMVIRGQIELTLHGAKTILRYCNIATVPANELHQFRNLTAQPAHLLCRCSAADMEEFSAAIGVPLAGAAAQDQSKAIAGKSQVESVPPLYGTILLWSADLKLFE